MRATCIPCASHQQGASRCSQSACTSLQKEKANIDLRAVRKCIDLEIDKPVYIRLAGRKIAMH